MNINYNKCINLQKKIKIDMIIIGENAAKL